MDRITIPVAARPTSRVTLDRAVFDRWNALGLPRDWFQTTAGPAYWGDDGRPVYVAAIILGRPYRLGRFGPNSLCLENLEPLDGTPATTAGLDALSIPTTN